MASNKMVLIMTVLLLVALTLMAAFPAAAAETCKERCEAGGGSLNPFFSKEACLKAC